MHNKSYVVFVPTMESNKLKSLAFPMIYDDKGNSLPTNSFKTMVNQVEILRDGKMYDVKTKLSD